MTAIRTITMFGSGMRLIVTDDGKSHCVQTNAPPEVQDHSLACGGEYPFVDDADGNAIGLLPGP